MRLYLGKNVPPCSPALPPEHSKAFSLEAATDIVYYNLSNYVLKRSKRLPEPRLDKGKG